MKTTNGKLRNITSGILHTDIGDVYKLLEEYLDEDGIMTHQLPSACKALAPILERKLSKEWFTKDWIKDGVWLNKSVELEDLSKEEKVEFWDRYSDYANEMWNGIKDKTIAVKT